MLYAENAVELKLTDKLIYKFNKISKITMQFINFDSINLLIYLCYEEVTEVKLSF